VLCKSVYSHAPHNDVSVIIILCYNTTVLQLGTVFSTVICCTGFWSKSNRLYHIAEVCSRLYYLGLCKYTL